MKAPAWSGFFVVAVLMGVLAAGHSQGEVLSLNEQWQLQSSSSFELDGKAVSQPGYDTDRWYRTAVPATVLAALVENGVFPDPYFGENLKAIPGYQDGRWLVMPLDSPFRASWWYRNEFTVPRELEGKHLTLHLDGINYRANVWLNGKQIADDSEVIGMFRRFVFPINEHARLGETNCLAVEVFSPGHLPEKDYPTKQVEATTGWDDHNPQPPDLNMGIWEDVYVRATGPVKLDHLYVHADLEVPALDKAALTMFAHVTNLTDEQVTAVLGGEIEEMAFVLLVRLEPNETREVEFSPSKFPKLNVANPRVWWPNPLGAQELYDAKLMVQVNGAVSDTATTRFGIREITSFINDEGWRTFKVNGHKVLIRGGAWMTADMLLRFSHRRYDALVRYAKEANLNMLRSEGFSIRETEEFYNLCDEHGVMVTQQIFGRSIPDEDLAVACIDDMMLRIRTHPSLAHFLGHDETFPTDTLDQAYRDLIEKYHVDRTYQPHSGAFDVKNRFKTGGTRTGTRELWTYTNPTHYYTHKDDGAWGFAQSGGIGGIVTPFESVRRMIPEDQRWPVWTDALSFHSVIQGGKFFDTAVKMLGARYGEPKDIEEFCLKAQAMNYNSARGMYEAYGRNKFDSCGITTWKYNAAWPAFMTWHYVDWYLNATGAYYGAKIACRPVHIQYAYDDTSVYIVNNRHADQTGLKVTAKIFNDDMTEQYAWTGMVNVPANGVAHAVPIPDSGERTKSHFLKLTLEDNEGAEIDSNFYWLSTVPDVPDKMDRDWRTFSVSPKSIADHTDLDKLPKVKLHVSSEWEKRGDETVANVTLANPTAHLAFLIHLAVRKGENGDEVCPTYWGDNYVSLLPGEQRVIKGVFATSELADAEPALKIDGWNIQE